MNTALQVLPLAGPLAGWAAHTAWLARRLRTARTDPLTGLPTRAAFTGRAHRAIHRSGSAVLLIDLNHFKPLNDRFGHAAGDQVLAAVGQRLGTWCARHGGFAGRLGGDEFAAVASFGPRAVDQAAAVRELLWELGEPVDVDGTCIVPSASIGVCHTADRPGADLTALLRSADEAMYSAKFQSRRYELAHSSGPIFRTAAGRRSGRPGTHEATAYRPEANR